MQTSLNAYISFTGNAREAITFYQTVFGGTVTIHTFQEYGAAQDPADAEKVMHGMLAGDNGISFMAADTPSGMEHSTGSRISMCLDGNDEATLSDYFEKLADGGTVTVPLEKAQWGDTFGMLIDKFGITWMVNIRGSAA